MLNFNFAFHVKELRFWLVIGWPRMLFPFGGFFEKIRVSGWHICELWLEHGTAPHSRRFCGVGRRELVELTRFLKLPKLFSYHVIDSDAKEGILLLPLSQKLC